MVSYKDKLNIWWGRYQYKVALNILSRGEKEKEGGILTVLSCRFRRIMNGEYQQGGSIERQRYLFLSLTSEPAENVAKP